jgi:hypothetical protein
MSKTKKKKLTSFNALCLLAALILYIICLIVVSQFGNKSLSSDLVDDSNYYNCKTLDSAIKASNKGTLDYFLNNSDSYDSVFVSPLAVQGTLYSYYNKESKTYNQLFESFDNGYTDWTNASDLFVGEGFVKIDGSTVSDSESLVGVLSNSTKGYVNSLSSEIDFDENTIFSVLAIQAELKDAKYDSDLDVIYTKKNVKYKKTDSYEAVKFDLEDDRHTVYLVNGDLKDFSVDDFDNTDKYVMITPYIWQTLGNMNNLVSKFTKDSIDLKVINQFGFGTDSYTEKTMPKTEDSITFSQDYYVVVTNSETDKIVGVGKRD